jgi:hypothetical protein
MPRSSRFSLLHPFFFLPFLHIVTFVPVHAQGKFLESGEPTGRGAATALFLDTPFRSKLDLSGSWSFSDDGTKWQPVKIPAAYDFVGIVTFMRSFDIPTELLDRANFKLVAYGINYQSEVYINDVFVGKHVGGYTSFVLPVPENALQVGSNNVIKIVVDNRLNAKSTLPLRQQVWGWRNYGGIFRDLYLLATPKIWIDEVQAHSSLSPDYKAATVKVSAVADNVLAEIERKDAAGVSALLASRYRFWVALYDRATSTLVSRSPEQELTVEKRRTTKVETELRLTNPRLWRPDDPQLYTLKAFLVKDGSPFDEYDLNIGVRDIRVKGSDLYLNGNKLYLQGVLWREDHPSYGSALTYKSLEEDVLLIKGLGANVVRVGNHPPHPFLVNLCDRYGLLVMEEIPVSNVPAEILGRDYYQELAKEYAREMVLRDRNSPSVFAWGLGDDFDTSESASIEYVRSIRTVVESLDDRPVYYVTSMLNNDLASEEVDFAALSFSSCDVKLFKIKLEAWKEKHPTQPVIVGRFGKVVEPGNHNGYSDPMSMEAQARYLIQGFSALKEARIAGGIIDAFADWRGDRPIMTIDYGDRFLSTMGLVSYTREKRPAFEKVRALFNNEKIAALTMGTYSEQAPIVFVVLGFLLLLGFAYLLKSHRRFRENVIRSFLRPYNFFADVRDQRILSYLQTTLLALAVAMTLALVASSLSYHIRNSARMDFVLTHFLYSDTLKATLCELVWQPLKSTIVFSVIFALATMLLTGLVMAFSFFVQTKVYFFHAYSIVVWSASPVVLLIPVGMVMYRVMESEQYVLPLLLITAAVGIWVVVRLLKSIAIIYDVFPVRVYAGGVLVLLIFFGALLAYYNYAHSTLAYYKFFVNFIEGTS